MPYNHNLKHTNVQKTDCRVNSITGLKLIEAGVPKDKLALLAVPMIPLQILLPWVISKYTTGPKPMDVYLKAFPCRLLMGLVFALVVHITPDFMNSDGSFPLYYYGLLLFVYALHQVSKKRGQIIQKSPQQNERHFNFT